MANPFGYLYGDPVGRAVIKAFGGNVTPEKMRFFRAWAQAEGTKAKFNPFATTRRGFPGETSFNSVGVKNYPNLGTGIKATIDTLQLDYYTGITSLLRRDDTTAEQLAKAVASSPWGTGTGVLRVLGVTDADSYEVKKSAAKYGANRMKVETHFVTQTLTSERFRPSESYIRTLEAQNIPTSRLASGWQPFTRQIQVPQQVMVPVADKGPTAPTVPGFKLSDESGIYLRPSYKGTHVTDNLGWGTRSAVDILGAPGTPVRASEAGTVVYYHPAGAQGGGSILVRTASGKEYWIGHIDSDLGEGDPFERGQIVATISPEHENPHAHIDIRKSRQKGRRGR